MKNRSRLLSDAEIQSQETDELPPWKLQAIACRHYLQSKAGTRKWTRNRTRNLELSGAGCSQRICSSRDCDSVPVSRCEQEDPGWEKAEEKKEDRIRKDRKRKKIELRDLEKDSGGFCQEIPF